MYLGQIEIVRTRYYLDLTLHETFPA